MKRIFFIHIAKTGGVSVEENLIKATGLEPCPAYSWNELLKIENTNDYNLFIGHLQYFCKDIIGTAFSFTILREPIERALSGWEHILRSPDHPAWVFVEEAPDIRAALKNRNLRRHLSNAMTWFLGPRPSYQGFKTKELAISHAIDGFADNKMLESAKECIDKLDFIGFTEALNQDTLKLFSLLGLEVKAGADLVVKNSNPQKKLKNYRESLSNEALGLLLEANAFDYELYRYAQQVAYRKWG